MAEAARVKMFGRLTRERVEWRPTSLLCKRFNVPEPFSSASGPAKTGLERKPTKFSVFDFLDATAANARPEPVSRASPEPPVDTDRPLPVRVKMELPEPASAAVSTDQAAVAGSSLDVSVDFPDLPEKVDLFRAIFLSGDESSSDEEDAPPEPPAAPAIPAAPPAPPVIPPERLENVQRNTSPPRGIFANLDLDAINQRNPVKQEMAELPEDAYGPALPSGGIPVNARMDGGSSSSGDSDADKDRWVEKSSKARKEKRKERAEKDRHRHKKASKHKKEKKHKSHKKKKKK